MLFRSKDWPGIADGWITLTFRTWKSPQAVAGRRYRTPVGMIEVSDVRQVTSIADIPVSDLARAGEPDLSGDGPWTRVEFHFAGDDPRTALSQSTDVTGVVVRPELEPILRLIASQPGVRAADLAASMGRERLPFKVDVRKLKALGLTESLPVGYRLSPRGEAYLRCTPSDTAR
jgi:hypothetical protein